METSTKYYAFEYSPFRATPVILNLYSQTSTSCRYISILPALTANPRTSVLWAMPRSPLLSLLNRRGKGTSVSPFNHQTMERVRFLSPTQFIQDCSDRRGETRRSAYPFYMSVMWDTCVPPVRRILNLTATGSVRTSVFTLSLLALGQSMRFIQKQCRIDLNANIQKIIQTTK